MQITEANFNSRLTHGPYEIKVKNEAERNMPKDAYERINKLRAKCKGSGRFIDISDDGEVELKGQFSIKELEEIVTVAKIIEKDYLNNE